MKKSRGIIFLLLILVIIASLSVAFNVYSLPTRALNYEIFKAKQSIPWGVEYINAPTLWQKVTGKGVKVAVMDSGINFSHPEFGKGLMRGYNAIDPAQPPIDDYGHGTLVCGVIAAQNNGFGIVGVAPDVELYPIKVLDEYGEGDILDIIDGINWCIEKIYRL